MLYRLPCTANHRANVVPIRTAGNYDEYFGMATDVDAVVYLMLVGAGGMALCSVANPELSCVGLGCWRCPCGPPPATPPATPGVRWLGQPQGVGRGQHAPLNPGTQLLHAALSSPWSNHRQVNNVIHDFFPTAITIGEDVSGMPTFCRPWQVGAKCGRGKSQCWPLGRAASIPPDCGAWAGRRSGTPAHPHASRLPLPRAAPTCP